MALVILPVHILHQVNLPRDERIMVLSVFLCSILTTLLSIVHTIFFFRADPIMRILTGQLEASLNAARNHV